MRRGKADGMCEREAVASAAAAMDPGKQCGSTLGNARLCPMLKIIHPGSFGISGSFAIRGDIVPSNAVPEKKETKASPRNTVFRNDVRKNKHLFFSKNRISYASL